MLRKIDLNELIAQKNPKLAKRLPGFVKAYLNRILHIREINEFLEEHHEKQGIDFANAGMEFLDLTFKAVGLENLHDAKRPLIVSNHPLGGLDGIALLTLVHEHLGNVRLLVNDFLMTLTNLRELFIPINKHGSNRANKNMIDEAVVSGEPLISFPAGVCSRKVHYGIYDLEWNKSFIKMARTGERDVLPIYVGGKNSRFFYNLANLRRKLGIKGNIEMIYLVNEMVKQRHAVLDIVIGSPIPYTVFTKDKTDWLWGRQMRDFIYKMQNGKPAVFDPESEFLLPETYFG